MEEGTEIFTFFDGDRVADSGSRETARTVFDRCEIYGKIFACDHATTVKNFNPFNYARFFLVIFMARLHIDEK